jgi:tRNA 2-thiouridine synthesizing protein A
MSHRSDGHGRAAARLDLAGEVCPMNYVRTKLGLESLEPGEVLEVLLDPGEGVRNVPRSAAEDGHEVLLLEPAGEGRWRLRIRRGAGG